MAQTEPQVDSLLARRPPIGKMGERSERLLEIGRRLAVSRPVQRARTGLGEVAHGLLPQFAAQRVIGEPLDLLGEPVGMQPFDDLDDPRVQRAAAARGAGSRR